MKTDDRTQSYTAAFRELPGEGRPRERLLRYGPQSLSTAELLAMVLQSGTQERSAAELAEGVIHRFQGLRGVAKASVKELSRVKGVGTTKAVQIAACVELGRRLAARVADPQTIIGSPDDVADLLLPELCDAAREHFKAVMLDTKNKVLKVATVSIGSLDQTIVHPREVFKEAIAVSAASVIVAHNHPSGDPTPSQEDRQVTARLVEAGRILGIELLDHLVLGADRWVSLKQLGML
jgi:DNA repair protein RadC